MKEFCVDLEIAKELKENGFPQKSVYNHVNSSYNTGMEGESIYWLCDNKWDLYDFSPDSEYHDTGKETKEEGLIPDFVHCKTPNAYKNYKEIASGCINKILVYSSPTSDEIIKELPSNFIYEGDHFWLTIIKDNENNYQVYYEKTIEDGFKSKMLFRIIDKKLSNCLSLTWLYLKKEGYIK